VTCSAPVIDGNVIKVVSTQENIEQLESTFSSSMEKPKKSDTRRGHQTQNLLVAL